MKLYHGTKSLLDVLKPSQAVNPEGVTDKAEGELRNAIYLSPDYKFAVAMAVRPPGLTEIDNNNHVITFSNPEQFNPDEVVYVYELDGSKISQENMNVVDERIIAVAGLPELNYEKRYDFPAREVLKYYEITNWRDPEIHNETSRK